MEEEAELETQHFRLSPAANAATESLAALASMQRRGQLCDVVLETESGDQIWAHRNVLAACSPYFRAMFVNNLVESNQKVVYIKDINFNILEAVVSFAYNTEFSLPSEQALSLLVASDRLQVRPLFTKCSEFLETQLRPDNCLSIRAFAELHNCQQLFKLCTEYVSENFEKVVQCEEYLSLPCTQLKDLISRDEVRVSSEEQVYTAVLLWVYHDLEARREEFASIMSHVRLPFVSSDFLACEVEQECLVQMEEQCQDFIQEAYLYKSFPEKRPSLKHSPRAKPRKLSGLQDVILAVGGMSKTQPLSSLEQYNIRSDMWTTLTEMEVPCYGLATCFLNGCLYAAGGFNESFGYLNSVECYNMKENQWTMVAPMHQARRYVHIMYDIIVMY